MAQLMTIDQMIAIAAGVGIRLEDAPPETANLYAWTDPELHVLYVGKASSKRRLDDEQRWKGLDHANRIVSGFATLLSENDAQPHYFRYEPADFDRAMLTQHVRTQGWEGNAIDSVLERLRDEGGAPAPEEVEGILVRLHVRTGRLIGNSQYASQWETPIGSFTDTVAALAADAARATGVLPERTVVATEGIDAVETGGYSESQRAR